LFVLPAVYTLLATDHRAATTGRRASTFAAMEAAE
jgi:hypothetical protein